MAGLCCGSLGEGGRLSMTWSSLYMKQLAFSTRLAQQLKKSLVVMLSGIQYSVAVGRQDRFANPKDGRRHFWLLMTRENVAHLSEIFEGSIFKYPRKSACISLLYSYSNTEKYCRVIIYSFKYKVIFVYI